MIVLRATQKVLRLLPPATTAAVETDAALGDWYVNRIVIDRQPLLLLVSSLSLLAMVEPARGLKQLPLRLADLVGARLARLPVDKRVIACEVDATRAVMVGRTANRSVLGQLVDFAKALTWYLPEGGWGERDLRIAEDKLAETPCHAGGRFEDVIWPDRKARQLLETTWPASQVRH